MSDIQKIKILREETGVSFAECNKALEKANGDVEVAKTVLKELGRKFAAKKKERVVGQGIIDSYIHQNKKMGALIELRCETDFVAKSEGFQNLAHEICLQVVAIDPSEVSILEQPWIKDGSKAIKDLIDEEIARSGENISIGRCIRFAI